MKQVTLDEIAALMWWSVAAFRLTVVLVVIGAPALWLHANSWL